LIKILGAGRQFRLRVFRNFFFENWDFIIVTYPNPKSYFDYGLSIKIQYTKLDCNLDWAIRQSNPVIPCLSWPDQPDHPLPLPCRGHQRLSKYSFQNTRIRNCCLCPDFELITSSLRLFDAPFVVVVLFAAESIMSQSNPCVCLGVNLTFFESSDRSDFPSIRMQLKPSSNISK